MYRMTLPRTTAHAAGGHAEFLLAGTPDLCNPRKIGQSYVELGECTVYITRSRSLAKTQMSILGTRQMQKTKATMADMMVTLKLTILLTLIISSHAFSSLRIRSTGPVSTPLQGATIGGLGSHFSTEELLTDVFFRRGDIDHNSKLSASEIESFFLQFTMYTPYVCRIYGRKFVEIADFNGDSQLDRQELVSLLSEMTVNSERRKR
ncbi:hypothetical protein ACJMK2_025767 [Sinanodonta woodiana]|uniref:Calmodulin n=1 Tax=Sinanodonta woodiana TaxID=1069815 RepID=A0ABD3XHI5_SINWO